MPAQPPAQGLCWPFADLPSLLVRSASLGLLRPEWCGLASGCAVGRLDRALPVVLRQYPSCSAGSAGMRSPSRLARLSQKAYENLICAVLPYLRLLRAGYGHETPSRDRHFARALGATIHCMVTHGRCSVGPHAKYVKSSATDGDTYRLASVAAAEWRTRTGDGQSASNFPRRSTIRN